MVVAGRRRARGGAAGADRRRRSASASAGLLLAYLDAPSKREKPPPGMVSGKATILDAAGTTGSVAGYQMVELTLEVRPKDGLPFQVKRKFSAGRLGPIEAGRKLDVLYDPANPAEDRARLGRQRRGARARAGSGPRGSWSGPAARRRPTRSRARRRPAPAPRTPPGASSGRPAGGSRSAAGTGRRSAPGRRCSRRIPKVSTISSKRLAEADHQPRLGDDLGARPSPSPCRRTRAERRNCEPRRAFG